MHNGLRQYASYKPASEAYHTFFLLVLFFFEKIMGTHEELHEVDGNLFFIVPHIHSILSLFSLHRNCDQRSQPTTS